MLDYFAIFTKGGTVLWTQQFTSAMRHSPLDAVNALVRNCLLERSADAAFTYQPKAGSAQSLKWTFDNRLGLVFVAIYQRALTLTYVDDLLASVRDEFSPLYKEGEYEYDAFEPTFARLLRDAEARAETARRPQQAPAPRAAAGAAPAARPGDDDDGGAESDGGDGEPEDSVAAALRTPPPGATPEASGDEAEGGIDRARLAKLGSRKQLGPSASRRAAPRRGNAPSKPDEDKATPEKAKKGRVWGGGVRGEEAAALDFSGGAGAAAAAAAAAAGAAGAASYKADGVSRMEEDDEDDDEWHAEHEAELEKLAAGAQRTASGSVAAPAKKAGVLGAFVSSLAVRVVGKEALSAADLAPALEDMKRKLMERNVAEEIAGQIVDSVARSLEGQKLSSFTGVSKFVRNAFEDALSGILNKRQVDVLHDIQRQKARGRPYVIVFCGVNGVGKSTNLAKICYWLGSQGLKVQLAACDTFRAGAVEQLKTHAVRLGVPLYERGYEKDPAKVALEAVNVAQRDGRDVVLVDTAGRMQDNEPLMRALASLIHVNNPNLVLFVGEALVGNDAVDQLVKFNRALHDLAPPGATEPHNIDGIVLTKFDTIDDKVGAAISMVYTSGAPVMFVGCGQTYVDLKKLNVKSVVRSLLS